MHRKRETIMRNTILWFVVFWSMTFLFTEIGIAQNSEPTCNEYKSHVQDNSELSCYKGCNQCTASCDEKYITPKHDVWGKPRRESQITRANRSKCKNLCLNSMESCINRKRKQNKAQEELESQLRETQEDTTRDAGYVSSPSESIIYKWTDKDGVINITNNKDSIPPEYREQLETPTNAKEAVVITEESE